MVKRTNKWKCCLSPKGFSFHAISENNIWNFQLRIIQLFISFKRLAWTGIQCYILSGFFWILWWKIVSFSALSTVPSQCILFLSYFFTMILKNLCSPDTALLSNGEGTWQSLHCYLEKGSEDNLSCFCFEELQDLFGRMSANVKNPTMSTPILAGHCITNEISSISL